MLALLLNVEREKRSQQRSEDSVVKVKLCFLKFLHIYVHTDICVRFFSVSCGFLLCEILIIHLNISVSECVLAIDGV